MIKLIYNFFVFFLKESVKIFSIKGDNYYDIYQ